jgi:hypothetical protein
MSAKWPRRADFQGPIRRGFEATTPGERRVDDEHAATIEALQPPLQTPVVAADRSPLAGGDSRPAAAAPAPRDPLRS